MSEKIVIIDDDIDTLRLIKLVLKKEGYQVIAANDGKKGLQKISQESPDLILLDVMMPEMDGYEVARRLRRDPLMAKVPILMFTAKSQVNDKETGFQAGADDYLTKPTRPEELQAHVKKLLSLTDKRESNQPEQREELAPALSKSQRSKTFGVISDRFADWFTSIPSRKGK